jgi:hypothetical protein
MIALKGFEDAMRAAGVPTDRIALTKRNVELKGQLVLAVGFIRATAEVFHRHFQHDGTLDTCPSKICTHTREVLETLK